MAAELVEPGEILRETNSLPPLAAPGDSARSFLNIEDTPRYSLGSELLTKPSTIEDYWDGISFSPNPAYDSYLRMHKVLLGEKGAAQLVEIHEALCDEALPRYLSAAGWAAAEASLILTDRPASERLALLDSAVRCWENAIAKQIWLNGVAPDALADSVLPYRMALDVAIAPLFSGMIQSNITHDTLNRVFEDCLTIAAGNLERLEQMRFVGHDMEIGAHVGFAYECNALLAGNFSLSPSRFVIPAPARADNGHYYSSQTHDLLVISQQWGRIQAITPVEIKTRAKRSDRLRYMALLMRGKMHLSVQGLHGPEHTLEALAATHHGTATSTQYYIAQSITERFHRMAEDYRAGEVLGRIATRSVTGFRSNDVLVRKNHPGFYAQSAS